jgi:hypothetical protein
MADFMKCNRRNNVMSVSMSFDMEKAEKVGVKFTPITENRQDPHCPYCGGSGTDSLGFDCYCEIVAVTVGYHVVLPHGIGEGFAMDAGFFQCKNINRGLRVFFLKKVPGSYIF